MDSSLKGTNCPLYVIIYLGHNNGHSRAHYNMDDLHAKLGEGWGKQSSLLKNTESPRAKVSRIKQVCRSWSSDSNQSISVVGKRRFGTRQRIGHSRRQVRRSAPSSFLLRRFYVIRQTWDRRKMWSPASARPWRDDCVAAPSAVGGVVQRRKRSLVKAR